MEWRVNECKKIAELIFSIFHYDLKPTLFSKALSSSLGKLRFQVPDTPKLPIKSFNPEVIRKEFTFLKNIKIHYSSTENIASIHEFAIIPENSIDFKYNKMKKGASIF